ncbi:MAG: prepilin-type N-terminal cleavage/methylation domain-containing protein [Patescibacteria group bacterium]
MTVPKKTKKTGGFTVLELLIVIAIIGILASIIMVTMNNAKIEAENVKATLEIKNLRSSIVMLENDTSKWPNGCEVDEVSNPEVDLIDANAGLLAAPSVFSSGTCSWNATDIARWKGPYAVSATDLWNHSYVFDPDYHVCVNSIDVAYSVVASYGRNGTQNYPTDNASVGGACNLVTSDDIYIKLTNSN